MKTAKEYLQDKYPQMRGHLWNSNPNINDEWLAEIMEEYASTLKELVKAYEEYFKFIDEFNPFSGDDEEKGKQLRKRIEELSKLSK